MAELAKDATQFDAVFSDVVMLGMSGIELGQRIRQDYHDLPVVLTSGYSQVLAQNSTYDFELLHKPYSIKQLSRVLRKVATWQRRRRILAGSNPQFGSGMAGMGAKQQSECQPRLMSVAHQLRP